VSVYLATVVDPDTKELVDRGAFTQLVDAQRWALNRFSAAHPAAHWRIKGWVTHRKDHKWRLMVVIMGYVYWVAEIRRAP
jgi:dTDP-4-dehydrorhamnose 3,5-epimerase-like enzyme